MLIKMVSETGWSAGPLAYSRPALSLSRRRAVASLMIRVTSWKNRPRRPTAETAAGFTTVADALCSMLARAPIAELLAHDAGAAVVALTVGEVDGPTRHPPSIPPFSPGSVVPTARGRMPVIKPAAAVAGESNAELARARGATLAHSSFDLP